MQRDMDDEHRPRRRPGTILGRALAVALAALVVGPAGAASAAEEAPLVTTQPAGQEVTEPESATFTAAASGTPTPTVQWEYAEVAEFFIDVPGATSTTLTVTNTAVSQSGFKYRARFTNSAANCRSRERWSRARLNCRRWPIAPATRTRIGVTSPIAGLSSASTRGLPAPSLP